VVQCWLVYTGNVCVQVHVSFSFLDGSSAPVTCSCVPTKHVSQGLEHGRNPYSESELVVSRIHANQKNSEFSVSRSDFDYRCNPGVSCSWMEFDFCFAIENSRSFKTVICSTNFSSHCLSRDAKHIRLTAFRWRSRNEGDLFGSWKIDADKSCNQLLKIVLRYRGHLHEESSGVIFRYSKEWKSFTIDIVSKSAQNTHLTAEPILKQCAVHGSRPPIASKPGSSSPEQYGLNNITSQPWSDATCPRTTSDSAYLRFVTLF